MKGSYHGHLTLEDGRHVPLTADMASALWDASRAEQEARATAMPTEQDAIRQLMQAQHRLRELGWNDPCYCPKDGSEFDVITRGSSGIFKCAYVGQWPNGSWWTSDGTDVYGGEPFLYRVTEREKAMRAALAAQFAKDRDGQHD